MTACWAQASSIILLCTVQHIARSRETSLAWKARMLCELRPPSAAGVTLYPQQKASTWLPKRSGIGPSRSQRTGIYSRTWELLPKDLFEAVALLQREELEIGDIPLPPSPSPAASMLSRPPVIPPAPQLQEVPQAALAPRPQELTALGKSPSLGPLELLETGSLPALCAGRRDWSKGQVMLEIPAIKLKWPPSNWEEMPKDQKRAAWQAIATLYTWMDEPDGRFPASSPGLLMDDFSFLALPGSGNGPEPKTSVDKVLGQLRASNHRALKQVAGRGAPLGPKLKTSLQASHHAGPARRHAVLQQVADAKIPLHPLWKAPPATPSVKPPLPVPVYSPMMPEMWKVKLGA